MNKTVHLVRHGQVDNPKSVIYGRMPGFHLSEKGRLQAEAAAERLSAHDIGAVWSSPLERAQETAEAIARKHHLTIQTDERLIESDTRFETFGRTILGFGRSLATSPRHWWGMRNPLRPSWGESYALIRARMVAAITDAIESSGGRELVVVSHQSPVRIARLALSRSRVPPWLTFAPCDTGSVSTLVLEEDRVVSASYFAPRVEEAVG